MSEQVKKTAAKEQPDKAKPRGRAFKKGASGNPSGRPKGSLNKASQEAKAFATMVVDSPEYQATIWRRALKGKLHAAIESMLWHYAKGKPTETVRMMISQDQLKAMKPEALAELEELSIRAAAAVARMTTE